MKVFIFLYFILFISLPAYTQTVIYVNQNATGANTGESWSDAFTDLQDALSSAFSGFEIWVAQGVYKPTSGTARGSSFYLVNGVKMYGGFKGDESSVLQRDPAMHPTILSGEIGDPATRADNVYHVVQGIGLNSNTLLDGFIIRDGNTHNDYDATGADIYGGGLLLQGAAWIDNSRPVINNCCFEYCGSWYGGGMAVVGWAGLVNPHITNCTFSYNKVNELGGGLYKSGATGADTFALYNCGFYDNSAWVADGGGVGFAGTPDSKILLRQCRFERDTAFQGGAVFHASSNPSGLQVDLILDSCYFYQNFALDGGAIYYDGYVSTNPTFDSITFNFTASYCTFDANKVSNGDGGAFLFRMAHSSTLNGKINYCYFKNNLSGYFLTQSEVFRGSTAKLIYAGCHFQNNRSNPGDDSSCFCIHTSCGGGQNPASVETDIQNCLFVNNGSGVISLSSLDTRAKTNITNCTFYRNGNPLFAKTDWIPSSGEYYNYFRVENCILWEPDANPIYMFYNNDAQNLTMYGYEVNNSLISLDTPNPLPGATGVFGANVLFGVPPMFVDTSAGDFRLQPCSPAVNAGDNDKTEDAGILFDLDSLPRIRFGRVDLGAYESQDSCMDVGSIDPTYKVVGKLEFLNNPSRDGILNMRLPDDLGREAEISVYDMSGRLQAGFYPASSETTTFDLSRLSPGAYVILLRYGEVYLRGKWIRT